MWTHKQCSHIYEILKPGAAVKAASVSLLSVFPPHVEPAAMISSER